MKLEIAITLLIVCLIYDVSSSRHNLKLRNKKSLANYNYKASKRTKAIPAAKCPIFIDSDMKSQCKSISVNDMCTTVLGTAISAFTNDQATDENNYEALTKYHPCRTLTANLYYFFEKDSKEMKDFLAKSNVKKIDDIQSGKYGTGYLNWQAGEVGKKNPYHAPYAFKLDQEGTMHYCLRKCWAVWRTMVRGKTPLVANEPTWTQCACADLQEVDFAGKIDEEFIENLNGVRHNMVILQGEQARGRFVDHKMNLAEELKRFTDTAALFRAYSSSVTDPNLTVFNKELTEITTKGKAIITTLDTALTEYAALDFQIRETRALMNLFFDSWDFRIERGEPDDFDLWTVIWDNQADVWDLRVKREAVNGLPVYHTFETSGRLNSGMNVDEPYWLIK